jgi:glyoxylase I family protein
MAVLLPHPVLSHIALTVTDLERSTTWYRHLFGIEEVLERDRATWHRRVLRRDGFQMSLSVHEATRPEDRFDETRVGMDHVAIGCRDRAELDAWLSHVDALGIEHAPVTETPETWVVAVHDPDGIPIEFFCRR